MTSTLVASDEGPQSGQGSLPAEGVHPEPDNSSQNFHVFLRAGETLAFSLHEASCCGYLWTFRDDTDGSVVEVTFQQKSSSAVEVGGEKLVGGSQDLRVSITGVAHGTKTYQHRRPWAPDDVIGSFCVDVEV